MTEPKAHVGTPQTVRERGVALVRALGAAGAPLAAAVVSRLQDEDMGVRWAALRALGSVGPAAAEIAEEAVRVLMSEADAATRKTAEEALASMAPDSQAHRKGIVEGLEQHYFKLVQAPPGSAYRTKGDRVRCHMSCLWNTINLLTVCGEHCGHATEYEKMRVVGEYTGGLHPWRLTRV